MLLFAAGCLAGAVAGCGEPDISEEQASEYVDGWSPSVEDTLRQMAVAPAGKKNLRERLSAASERDLNKSQRDEPPYDVFIDQVYAELDYEFELVSRTGLTERGQAVWRGVRAVEDHALSADGYPIEAIEAQLDELDEANTRFEQLDQFETSDEELQAARKWLSEQPVSAFDLEEANHEELTKQVLSTDSGRRMQERLADYETVSAELAEHEAKLEQQLARSLLRYARQMKHFRIKDIFIHPRHDDRWNNPNIEERRPDRAKGPYQAGVVWRRAAAIAEEMSDETEILHDRLRQTLRDAITGDAEATVAGLAPEHPQYDLLQKEYLRYKKIADDGGWQEVPATGGLRPGRSHATVEKLKERLKIEGYYPDDAPIDTTYDEALEDAVEAYQTTHQMQVTGRPHNVFWSSLNTSATKRSKQIALNMQRWRESNIDHSDSLYAFINIPDFYVELWKDQQLHDRIRIVVGNNDQKVDEETEEKENPNRTPTLSAYIDRVIYNPYWNVTERIRAEETLPEVRKSVEASYKAKVERLVQSKLAEEKQESAADEEETSLTDGGSYFGARGQDGAQAEPDEQRADEENDEGTEDGAEETSTDAAEEEGEEKAESPASAAARTYWSKNADDEIVFDVAKLRSLVGSSAGGSSEGASGESAGEAADAPSALTSQFRYLDPETGRVDVSSTDPDHIPAWYEENDYEVMFPGKKWEYVRMLQGEENALGKVKVIFPNMYDVYLHDTPAKELFNRDIRAFSHGCMRMHEPLTFAKLLLEHDGQLDDYNIDHILAETIYEPIFLKKRVPVHIDYFTVRVDDEGRANFLADIYDYDTFGDEG
ncbi:MAG: L,D-transpeptidase family protein [Persicimonas sp.]